MRRAVRNLIRFIAAGLIIFGGMEIGLEIARDQMRRTGISTWHCVVGASLIIAGGILMALSGKLAEHFTDDMEE
jgi:hypothetical protein